MSIEIFARVWLQYPGGGPDFKLALALADSADVDGFVYIEATLWLLHKARLPDHAAFERALSQMQAKGWLAVADPAECLYRIDTGPRTKRCPPPNLPAHLQFLLTDG